MSDTVKMIFIAVATYYLGPKAGSYLSGGATSGFTYSVGAAVGTVATTIALSKALGVGGAVGSYQAQLAERNNMVSYKRYCLWID